jgi:hypothetical protein
MEELDGLKLICGQINELFALKQQQVGVLQAWDAARQAEESILQGRSLPVFTIVTILFVGTPAGEIIERSLVANRLEASPLLSLRRFWYEQRQLRGE